MAIMPTSRRTTSGNKGFTLFEIVIALALIGLILGLAVGRMGDTLDRDMKKTANRLAATIRYLYDKSATEGISIRLVLDLQEQTYWVESTRDPMLLANPETLEKQKATHATAEKEKKETKEKKEKKETEATTETETTKGEGKKKTKTAAKSEKPAPLEPKEPVFSQLAEHLLKPSRLPESVFFKDVYVEHLHGPVDAGQVAITFFPNGYVEEAIINLRDEHDDVHYSLATNPATGRVVIDDAYRRLEEK